VGYYSDIMRGEGRKRKKTNRIAVVLSGIEARMK